MSHLVRLGSLALVVALIGSLVLPTASPVAADTFTNSNSIDIPGSRAATPYPSTIVVSGLTGLITKVTLTLTDLDHSFQPDIDMLLVGPAGEKVLVMSDAGGAACGIQTFTLDDAAANPLPTDGSTCPDPGTNPNYRPTNGDDGSSDTLPSPAPGGPYGTVLSAFNGSFPNGTWSLYIVDDFLADTGSLGSWSLNITTPMNGTVPFPNTDGITINDFADSGPASPYPSTLTVSGLTGTITKVTLTLTDLSHNDQRDLDVLLVGPAGQKVLVMSDAGGPDCSSETITLDDAAADPLPTDACPGSNTYRPTNNGAGDTFPSPAPGGPYGASLSDYNGTNPNGTWSLYIVDAFPGDIGRLGGWSLNITTASTTPTATATSTATATGTPTEASTATATSTATITSTGTPSPSATSTSTPSATATASRTATATASQTATVGASCSEVRVAGFEPGGVFGGDAVADAQWVAQSFQVSSPVVLSRVSLLILNRGFNTSDSIRVQIQSDNSGIPSGTVLGVDTRVYDATEAFRDFTPGALNLSAGTTYHIVASNTETGSTEGYGWIKSNPDVYAGFGKPALSFTQGATWLTSEALVYDYFFQVFGTTCPSTSTATATVTPTSTPSPTATGTPTNTPTPTVTRTPTVTSTPTRTPTGTRTPTITPATNGVDLTIAKSASPDPVSAGGTLTYTLVVYNSGQFATPAHKVRDPIPAGTSNPRAGTGCYVLSGAVWCNVPYLPRGGAAFFSFTVRVDAPAGSTLSNTAHVDWDKQVAENNEQNNTATIQTTVGGL